MSVESAEQQTLNKHTGCVKWFNNKSGYGFITLMDDDPEFKGRDIFSHHSSIKSSGDLYKYLVQGEYVEFDVQKMDTKNEHEHQAVNITGIMNGDLMCETRHKNKDYTKVYSRSGNELDITINLTDSNGKTTVLIQDGTLKIQPQSQVSTPPPTDPNLNLTAASAISGGSSVNIGDINVPGGVPGGYNPLYPSYVKDACGNYIPSYIQRQNPYLLPGSDPILMNQYNTPFYGQYSSFESAMNNPSNPLVNPVNSMNPVEYSQTLFGPWTTPMMSKTACLNCDETNPFLPNRSDLI